MPDLAAVPATVAAALQFYQVAADSWQRKDAAGAVYHYQAAVVSALRATDRDGAYRSAITGDMTQRWAARQAGSGQPDWALASYDFALKLFRDLAAEDRDQYAEGLVALYNKTWNYAGRASAPTPRRSST